MAGGIGMGRLMPAKRFTLHRTAPKNFPKLPVAGKCSSE